MYPSSNDFFKFSEKNYQNIWISPRDIKNASNRYNIIFYLPTFSIGSATLSILYLPTRLGENVDDADSHANAWGEKDVDFLENP